MLDLDNHWCSSVGHHETFSDLKLRLGEISQGRSASGSQQNNRPRLGSERTEKKNMDVSAARNGWMDGERSLLLRDVEWRETARERWRRGGRTISAGTGAQDRRRSAGYRSTLPFFLHNDTEAHAERQQVSQHNNSRYCAINKHE